MSSPICSVSNNVYKCVCVEVNICKLGSKRSRLYSSIILRFKMGPTKFLFDTQITSMKFATTYRLPVPIT